MALTTRTFGTVALAVAALTMPLATAVSAAPASGNGDLPQFGPGAQYRPNIEPADFSANIGNPWFPLRPGTTMTYAGTREGKQARELVTVTGHTQVIDGVTTRIVFDRLFLNGKLAERTFDYYAQDDDGNVWYFGEDTAGLDEHGQLTDTSGSFRAGVKGAQPGVFMQAHPEIGRLFRQEWFAGQAEDQFKVVSFHGNVTVPFGSFHNALKTAETTDLEPGTLDNKYYVRGVGEVKELAVQGPSEQLSLVKVEKS
jgi:hypothetical protein